MDFIPKQEILIKHEPSESFCDENDVKIIEIKEEISDCNKVKYEDSFTPKFEEVEIKSEPLYLNTPINSEKLGPPQQVFDGKSDAVEQSSNYKCDVCDYKTTGKVKLKWHKCIHSNKTVYSCNECDYQTTTEMYFHRHSILHTRDLLKCKFCDFTAPHLYRYNRHMATHSSTKPLKCILCDYSSSEKTHLQRHMSIHTGVKPLKCDKCDYRTAYKRNMNKHQENHKKGNFFKCNKCDYRTTRKSNFDMHIHNIVEVETSTNPNVEKRVKKKKKVSAKKYFECNECGYKTMVKRLFECHLPTHIKEVVLPQSEETDNYFKCNKCDYKTIEKLNFDMHIHNIVNAETSTNLTVKKCAKKKKKKSICKNFFECKECDYKTRVKYLFECHLPTHIKEVEKVLDGIAVPAKTKQTDKYSKSNKRKYQTVERNFPFPKSPIQIADLVPTNMSNHQNINVNSSNINVNSGFVYVVNPLQILNQNYYVQM